MFEELRDVPLWVLLVRFSSIAYRLCPKLDEAVIELPMRPVEPLLGSDRASISRGQTYFGYEVSPSPKEANFTCCRHPGRRRALRSAFQKVWLLAGKSP